MILTTHALTGAVIGKSIDSSWLIIILSLIIHFIMDSFRHGEYFDSRVAKVKNTWWKIALDLVTGFIIIVLFLFLKKPNFNEIINVFIGAFFSILPDFITLIHWTFKNNKTLAKVKEFHSWAHHYSKIAKYSPERQWVLRNAANDIIISLIASFLLFIK